MTAKIDLYREILELEPGSKVFFPLARLLAEAGEKQEAISVLHKGLQRHPDFLEARFALVDILHTEKNADAATECDQEVATITRLFKKYPAFLDAWADSEQGNDAALAIHFLKAATDSPGISLSEIFLRGLEAVGLISASFATPAPKAHQEEQEKPLQSAPAITQPEPAMNPNFAMQSAQNEPPANPLQQAAHYLAQPATPVRSIEPQQDEEDDESEDSTITVRTRSMAELLVVQGDIPGALEIYRELEAKASTPEEAADLKKRITTLVDKENTALATESVTDTPPEDSDMPDDAESALEAHNETPQEPHKDESNESKNITVNLLEKLAQGLEERAKK